MQPLSLQIIMGLNVFFSFLGITGQNNLTLCKKHHKFRLLSISADDSQAVPSDVRY